MVAAAKPADARTTGLLPSSLFAWWLAAAALAAAFAAGAVVGANSVEQLPLSGSIPASTEDAVLYSDVRPPDVRNAVDDVAGNR